MGQRFGIPAPGLQDEGAIRRRTAGSASLCAISTLC